MARLGTIYSYDYGQSVYFPAHVSATAFIENGVSLIDRYAALSHTHPYLPLSGGTMTGNIVLSNNKYISGKTTSSTEATIFGPQSNNNIQLGNTSFNDIVSYNNILPSSTNAKNLGTASYQWNAIYGNYISGNTFEATSYYNTYGESVNLTNAYVVTDDENDAYETRYGLRAIKNITSNGTYKLTMPGKSGTIATMADVEGTLVEIVDLTTLND